MPVQNYSLNCLWLTQFSWSSAKVLRTGLLPSEGQSCCTGSSPVSLRLLEGFVLLLCTQCLTFAHALNKIMMSKIDFRVSPALLEKSWWALLRKHLTIWYICPWFSKGYVQVSEPLDAHLCPLSKPNGSGHLLHLTLCRAATHTCERQIKLSSVSW